MTIRDRLWGPLAVRVEDARVRSIEVAVREVWRRGPFADPVAGVLSYVCEDVGADIPAAEGVQVPGGLVGG